MARPRATFPCPACGVDVRAGALACPACGADARTGWDDDEDAAAVHATQGLDLPTSARDDDEAYDAYVREEFEGEAPRPSPPSRAAVFLVVLVVLGVAAVLALLTSGGKP